MRKFFNIIKKTGLALWNIPKILVPFLFAGSLYIVMLFLTETLAINDLAYLFYGLSAYLLCNLCLRVIPSLWKFLKDHFLSVPFFSRLVNDTPFRARFFMLLSLIFNIFFGFLYILSGKSKDYIWLTVFGAYYLLLAIGRLILTQFMFRKLDSLGASEIRKTEQGYYRFTGILLLILHLVFTCVIYLMVNLNDHMTFKGPLIYAMAAYTFYCLIISIINLCSYKKFNSPVLLASRAINLCCALMSLLSLEGAMLSAFGGEATFRKYMLMGSGTVICIIELVLAFFMVIKKMPRTISS